MNNKNKLGGGYVSGLLGMVAIIGGVFLARYFIFCLFQLAITVIVHLHADASNATLANNKNSNCTYSD